MPPLNPQEHDTACRYKYCWLKIINYTTVKTVKCRKTSLPKHEKCFCEGFTLTAKIQRSMSKNGFISESNSIFNAYSEKKRPGISGSANLQLAAFIIKAA